MSEESTWLPQIVTVFLVGVPALAGAGLIIAAVRRWLKLRALTAAGRPATARVVDNQLESWSDGRTSFRPVVTFRTEAGQDVTAVLADLDGFRSHLAGTEIPVVYDPANPAEATPARRPTGKLVVTLVFGVIFLLFAVCAYQVGGSMLDEFSEPF